MNQQGPDARENQTTWAGVDQPAAGGGESSTPRRIGPFRISRVIASGGMGTVYEAVRERPQQTVAIKLLKHGIGSERQRRRFDAESEFLASLHHPNIAQLYDVGIYDDDSGPMPYFVMEYIESARSIARYAMEESLPVRERIELFVDVCDAIEHGHGKGVLHRDLKPDNILVDAQGQVKVIDFGVARAIADDDGDSRHTSTGQLVGTVHYMSPEQVEADSSKLDERSDVYSLGVVLYELLTGRLPYVIKGNTLMAAARTIRDAAPIRPSRFVPALKGDLEAILLKALSKARDNRYDSVQQFKQDLQHYLNNEPITTRHTGSLYLVRHNTERFMLRHPVAAVVLTVLIAAAAAEFIGVPLLYKWTGAQRAYLTWLGGVSWLQPDVESLEHVRVVQITDRTVELLPELREAANAPEVNAEDWKSMRVLHGAFMSRLAETGVRVVAWDLRFPDATPYDERFVAGLQALEQRDIPVVIAVPTWGVDQHGYPIMSAEIRPHCTWGCTSAFFDAAGPWEIDLILYRDSVQTYSSFALRTAASYWNPEAPFQASFDPNSDTAARVDYFQPMEGPGQQRRPIGGARRIRLSSVWPCEQPTEIDTQLGLREGDYIGFYQFAVPSDEALHRSTVNYEWVMRAAPDELRTELQDKVVVIGDFRGDLDRAPTADGRLVHGCHGHASAIEALLQKSVILDERRWISRATLPVLALFGVGAGMFGAGRPLRRGSLLLLIAGAALVAALIAYGEFQYIFNPFIPIIGAVVACELAARIVRTRRSFLI